MARIRNSRKKPDLIPRAIIILGVAIALAVVALPPSRGQSGVLNGTQLLSTSEIESVTGAKYVYLSTPRCESVGGAAQGDLGTGTGVFEVCTETLNLTSSNSLLPSNLTLFYYRFTSNQTALEYVQALSRELNGTMWNVDTGIFRNAWGNPVRLYFVTEAGSVTPPATVLTAFALRNTTLLATSTYVLPASDKTLPEQTLVNLLYTQYTKLATTAR